MRYFADAQKNMLLTRRSSSKLLLNLSPSPRKQAPESVISLLIYKYSICRKTPTVKKTKTYKMKLMKAAAKFQSLSNEFRAYISDTISILTKMLKNINSKCDFKKKFTKFSVCKSKNFPELKTQNSNFNSLATRPQLLRSSTLRSKGKTLPATQISRHNVACTNSNTPPVPRAITSGGGTSSSAQLSLATQALQSQQSNSNSLRYRHLRMRDNEAAKLKGPVLCAFCEKRSKQMTKKKHTNNATNLKKRQRRKQTHKAKAPHGPVAF